MTDNHFDNSTLYYVLITDGSGDDHMNELSGPYRDEGGAITAMEKRRDAFSLLNSIPAQDIVCSIRKYDRVPGSWDYEIDDDYVIRDMEDVVSQ